MKLKMKLPSPKDELMMPPAIPLWLGYDSQAYLNGSVNCIRAKSKYMLTVSPIEIPNNNE